MANIKLNGQVINMAVVTREAGYAEGYATGRADGYADGHTEGHHAGYDEGRATGVQETNAATLALTGTEQQTAKKAIEEINATLASNLTDKGVEADATETTESLVDKVFQIESAKPWVEEWARNCTITGTLQNAEITEIGDLNFEKATELSSYMFEGNPNLTKVGNITTLRDVSLQYGCLFRNCSNLTSVGNISINLGGRYKSIRALFSNCGSLKTVGIIDAPLATDIDLMFSGCSSLEICGGIKGGAWGSPQSGLFYDCRNLIEIKHPLDFTSCTVATIMFRNCYALKEVRFVAGSINVSVGYLNHCGLLSDASIQSWVDGLADRTGMPVITQQLHADVKARLTEAQIATITAKNWSIA